MTNITSSTSASGTLYGRTSSVETPSARRERERVAAERAPSVRSERERIAAEHPPSETPPTPVSQPAVQTVRMGWWEYVIAGFWFGIGAGIVLPVLIFVTFLVLGSVFGVALG